MSEEVITRFDQMDISAEVLKAIDKMGFKEPSTVQAKTIPLMMSGVDIMAIAPTGTGKTCAFGIPMLEYMDLKDRRIQEVVLCPTRELAVQIGEELTKLAAFIPEVRIAVLYGGQPIVKQLNALKRNPQIIIATPGRLLDHMNRGNLRLDAVHTMVLDEADEMLNMGFVKDVTRIIESVPSQRQLVMFSATMSQDVMTIAWKFQHDPVEIVVEATKKDRPQITQYVIKTEREKKIDHLLYLLDADVYQRVMIFCNTKFMTDKLTSRLKKEGYEVECLHGDIPQKQRDVVMQNFKRGKFPILVATDVAARGIDVDDVEAVFNYDLPQDDEYYVHRIGRTGRAGRTGKAFTFIVGKEAYKLRDIERYCKTKMKAQRIPSLDDVANVRVENVFRKLEKTIEEEDLTLSVQAIQEYLDKNEATAMDLAAAFLKMELGDALGEQQDDLAQEQYMWESEAKGKGKGKGRRKDDKDMVRLFLNVGKKQKLKPGDILGAIAGESGLPGRAVGSIDMYDKYTFVDVPSKYYKQVIKSMKHAKIKGNRVNVEKAESK